MSLPTLSVINFSDNIDDPTAQEVIRAVNRQIEEDFAPVWGAAWDLQLHASALDPSDPDSLIEEPVQGEGVLYLVSESTLPGALGYHWMNASERPYGFVFTERKKGWSVTLSHEALELIVDPTANVLVPGPDPRDPTNLVLHAYEVCDAVERTSYEIDGVRVSNFITQSWFMEGDAPGTRNDFLGVGVESFNATKNSHLAFFDLATNQWIPDYLGQQDAQNAVQIRRAALYDKEKPSRPKTEQLRALLARTKAEAKERIEPRLGESMDRVLSSVEGIARSDRLGAWIERVKGE